MTKFTTITDAINWLAGILHLSIDGATWVYENTDCPRWDEAEFTSYDFMADPAIGQIPDEFVA